MKHTTKKNFPVLEMGCTACAARVAKILGELQGVTEANVNFASGMAMVEYDAKVISPQQMKEAVRQGGYDLVIVDNEEKKAEEAKVAVRNIRREANDKCKDRKKSGEMTEDELKQSEKSVQELTDKYIKEIDSITDAKKKEIMSI